MKLRGKLHSAAIIMLLMLRVSSVSSITCYLTEYQIGEECCPLCPAGNRVKTDCTEFRSTFCVSCSEETFMDKPNGLKKCTACSVCPAGSGLKVKKPCSRSSDTVCEALEGFFCLELTGSGCSAAQKHKSCKPGQYISTTGSSSSDAECSDCSSGTFSDGSSTSCQPHTQCETL
ncbi:tumor necrosis factor receptor superfamily member 14, partial [Austrofundulus limnaeus]|uniref:Tumor necrosis factor receptor superfamily member 14 n=1 Tax=Austrofundulus limnaeus TaxID=52670 RepID=A0A2I4AJX6_AUSLI